MVHHQESLKRRQYMGIRSEMQLKKYQELKLVVEQTQSVIDLNENGRRVV